MQGATTGSVTVDGVQFSSNTLTDEQMRDSLGVKPDGESKSEPVVESPAAEAPAVEAKTPPVEDKPRKKFDPTKDPETRISKATFEREEARREAARERGERERIEREYQDFRAKHEKSAPVTQPAGDPTFEQLLEKHKDASDPYAAAIREQVRLDLAAERKQAEEAQQASRQEEATKQRAEHEQRRMASFGEKMTAALSADAELQSRMESAGPEFMLTRPMGDAFIESDQPHKLIAYLLDHPEKHQEILAMDSGLKQFRAIARLDAQLETPASSDTPGQPARSKSAAQPPISPVGGGHAAPATGEPDPRTCTQEEFDAYWNAKERDSRMAGARR